jgi:hypothetical protein
VLLKVMQREEVLAMAQNLPDGHWLNLCTPDCDGFTYDVHASGCAGKADYHAGDWVSKVTIQLASQAEVVISDPQQRMTPLRCIVEDDWLLLPTGFTEREAFDADLLPGDHEAVCLVIGRGIRWDHPVDALSSYTDENDEYRDDWQENSARLWNALVSGLRGDSIADLVATALNTCTEVVASECHLPHMAVVRTTLAEPGARAQRSPHGGRLPARRRLLGVLRRELRFGRGHRTEAAAARRFRRHRSSGRDDPHCGMISRSAAT